MNDGPLVVWFRGTDEERFVVLVSRVPLVCEELRVRLGHCSTVLPGRLELPEQRDFAGAVGSSCGVLNTSSSSKTVLAFSHSCRISSSVSGNFRSR